MALEAASRDVIVSGLMLNFVPDKLKSLSEMKRVARAPAASQHTEDQCFPFCTPDGLAGLMRLAGLLPSDCERIEIATVFADFEDYWHPFTLAAGPAPG